MTRATRRPWLSATLLSLWILPVAAHAMEAPAVAESSSRQAAPVADSLFESEIRNLETKWLEAEFHGDVAFLDGLLAPGYQVLVAKTGIVRSKAELLAQVAKNAGSTKPPPPLTTSVVRNGDTVTAYSSMKGVKASGEAYEAHYVDVYQRREGRWTAVTGVDL